MTPTEAAQLWALLATAFPGGLQHLAPTQLKETRRLYESALADLPYAAGDAGVRWLIATWEPTAARAFPLVATIRRAIVTQMHGRRRAGIEAWGDLAKLTGAYEEERLETLDPIVRRCLEDLGWINRRPYYSAARGEFTKWTLALEAENEASDRARFCELYDRLATNTAEDATAGSLAPRVMLTRGEPQPIAALVAGVLGKAGR